MTCSKCEYLVRVKNKLGYNLYYCGYKKYGVLKALSGLYINNEEYRKNSKTCKYYKGVKQMTNTIEEFKFFTKEDMNKAQERIEVLEKENAELKAQVEKMKFENDDLKNFLKNNIIQNTNIYLQSLSN